MVSVSYGVYQMELELAGRTVGQAREALASSLNIDPRSAALVNGEHVEEHRTLQDGDRLEFVRLAGQKGAATPPGTSSGAVHQLVG